MTSADGSTRGRPRDRAVDDVILETALALFAEGGLAAATFDQVSKRTGVSRTSIYRRWKSRDELIVAALTRLRERSEAEMPGWAERSFGDVLDLFEEQVIKAGEDTFARNLLRHVLALGPDGAGIKRLYWTEIILPRRRTFTSMIEAARLSGEVSGTTDPDLIQDQMAGALAYRLLLADGPIDAAGLRTYVRQLLISLGLRP